MRIIRSIKDKEFPLPNWYTKDRYLNLKKSSINIIEYQLGLRRYLDQESKSGNMELNDYAELFSEFSICCNEEHEAQLSTDRRDENVTVLHSIDVLHMAPKVYQRVSKAKHDPDLHWEELSKPIHLSDSLRENFVIDGTGLFIGVSLSHATDKEILSEVSRLLKKSRKELLDRGELTRIRPKRFNMNEMYESLFSWPVFEYIDLRIWARLQGIKLSRDYYREAFDKLRFRKFEPHHISGSIKRNAEHALSFEFSEQISHLVKDQKKVNNFNPF